MAGSKSKVINFLIRNRHLFQGKLRKESFDFDTSISSFREQCEKGANKFMKIPKGVNIKEEFIEGIKSEWLTPEGAPDDKLIIYIHGGGYVSGSCNDHRSFVSRYANYCGVKTLQFEYRLAPEHPYPGALNDSVSIYRSVLDLGFQPQNIVFSGESAGGGLALALLLALKEKNIPLPAAVAVISPWTDLTCSGKSYQTKNKVSVAPKNSWNVFSHYYVGKNDANNPLISPLFGDLEGLPPLYINAATDDELLDDGEQFYFKAKNAGVKATFKAGNGMIHCYPLLAPIFKEATEAMNDIVNFVKLHLKIN